MTTLVLASQSPARLSTLRNAGIEPVVIVSGVDEDQLRGQEPEQLALNLSTLKAHAVAERDDVPEGALVLGCDSVLKFKGEALGKPHSPEVATQRWRAMRGRSGRLITGHTLIDTASRKMTRETCETVVHFAEVSDAEIEAYVATGEPLEVAGAFTVDGIGGAFIWKIEGDFHNVVGLSLPALRRMVIKLGHRWNDLWNVQPD
ncbi:Maf family protein [Nocardioides sp. Kera G14]|uniref:Maf family protein n=1 Tax=Nocardioides sp. Kera G14 TaxID=2884264 RepID=UPI001D10F9EA|nr:nucleoside triphosphate pyrophosphatase [Nocardioides sp. Kera G14]UDY24432.1 Maf-like protein [Nocardioides sp. Kera G14]